MYISCYIVQLCICSLWASTKCKTLCWVLWRVKRRTRCSLDFGSSHICWEIEVYVITQTDWEIINGSKCCWVRKENLKVEEEFKLGILAFVYYIDNYWMPNWIHAVCHEHSERANFSCLIIYRRIKFNRQTREGRAFKGAEAWRLHGIPEKWGGERCG